MKRVLMIAELMSGGLMSAELSAGLTSELAPGRVGTGRVATGRVASASLASAPRSRLRDLPIATVRWVDAQGHPLPDEPPDPQGSPAGSISGSIAGIAVSLRDECNSEIAHTATDEVGGFLFEGISAGDYTVVLTLPSSEDDRPALPPVQTWTGGSDGYRLTGTLR
jgi:hypothetical protein